MPKNSSKRTVSLFNSLENDCVFLRAIYSKQLVFSEELKRNAIFKNIKQSIAYGPDIEDVFLKLHTSLQVTVLQSKILNQRLIVANTHLYYHPDARNIRVIQVAMATTFLEVLKRKLQKVSYFAEFVTVSQ